MIEHIILWAAIAANVGGALYTVIVGQRKLRRLDAMIHELENVHARVQEFMLR